MAPLGSYLSERQWEARFVRDYSRGDAGAPPHDHARQPGVPLGRTVSPESATSGRACTVAVALWDGRDPRPEGTPCSD